MLGEMGLHGNVVTLPWIAGQYRTGEWQLSSQLWQPDMTRVQAGDSGGADLVRRQRHPGDPVLDRPHLRRSGQPARDVPAVAARRAGPDRFAEIKRQCESRLGTRLNLGRLERLGIPGPIAELLRMADRRLMRRRP